MTASKRTVLITGCSANSLGDVLAQTLHATNRWRVFATGRTESRLSHFSSLGIETLILDVNSTQSIADCVRDVSVKTGGSLDLLINNAGMHYPMPIADIDLNRAREVFETNVLSYIAVTQAFLPLLLRAAGYDPATKRMRSNLQGSGSLPGVVLHGSIAGVSWMPFYSAYNISKASVTMLADTMRLEFEPFGIRVIELKSGNVRSNITGSLAKYTLPSSSIYRVAEERVERHLQGLDAPAWEMDGNVWAREVVKQIEGGLVKPSSWFAPSYWLGSMRAIWVGGNSMVAWVMLQLPARAFDLMLNGMSGIDGVTKALRTK